MPKIALDAYISYMHSDMPYRHFLQAQLQCHKNYNSSVLAAGNLTAAKKNKQTNKRPEKEEKKKQSKWWLLQINQKRVVFF